MTQLRSPWVGRNGYDNKSEVMIKSPDDEGDDANTITTGSAQGVFEWHVRNGVVSRFCTSVIAAR